MIVTTHEDVYNNLIGLIGNKYYVSDRNKSIYEDIILAFGDFEDADSEYGVVVDDCQDNIQAYVDTINSSVFVIVLESIEQDGQIIGCEVIGIYD